MSLDVAFEVGRLYMPIKAIADAVSPSWEDVFSRLPGLRAYFPMGAAKSNGNTPDLSGNGLELVPTGSPTRGYDGNSYTEVGVATDFLNRLGSTMRISGVETYMAVALRGMTMGGWIYVHSLLAGNGGLVGLWGVTGQKSYLVYVNPSGVPFFAISGDGTAATDVSGGAVTLGKWFFWAARFTPSTEIAIFIDGVKSVNVTAIYASLFASTASFEVGRFRADNATILNAWHRDVFICSAILSDAQIIDIYDRSRPAM